MADIEKLYSRSTTWKDGDPSQTRIYIHTDCITGTNAGKNVTKRSIAVSPKTVKPNNIEIPRGDISIVRVGVSTWESTVKYGLGGGDKVGFSLKFNTGGGTISAVQAAGNSSAQGGGGVFVNDSWSIAGRGDSDFGGALNVDEKGSPQPVTLKVPQFSFSWSLAFPRGYLVKPTDLFNIGDLTGFCNEEEMPFDPRNPDGLMLLPGNVLFDGMSGSQKDYEPWSLEFKFTYKTI